MPEQPLVSNVSDTARWVAAYRAQESLRPDALFRDPFADRLAGEQGRAIAAKGPRQNRSGWPMVVRTRLIDDLIAASVRDGCDCVLNLAAGLDTRPYRMELPESLDWVEADLSPMIEEKEKLLAGEKPRCRLRREKVDLADREARKAFLLRATSGAQKVLVLTEGLLIYLERDVVEAIGRDLLAHPAIQWWVLDLNSPAIRQMLMKGMGSLLDNAPMKFAPPDGVAFFEKLGWKARDIGSFFREGLRLRRLPLFLRMFALFPEPDARHLRAHDRWSAVLRLERPSP
jgi:methyltransferase (TIGR00027 family)